MLRKIKTNWVSFARSIFIAMGVLWLPIEAYEGLTENQAKLTYYIFLLLSLTLGFLIFLIDGIFISGYLKDRANITSNGFDTKVTIIFDDLFELNGWKAIAVNDFFDSIVDEVLVSSQSLHGHVLNKFWSENRQDWQDQISSSVSKTHIEKERRAKGNHKRYPIGTTGVAKNKSHKMLFVALGKTDIETSITNANAEDLISAVRGLLCKAREVCSNETLYIPLMGSGLARVGIKNTILVDLILAGIFEETKIAKVTSKIVIVLPHEKKPEINLGNIEKDWN